MVFSGKTEITTFKLIQNAKMGVFWKIQDICYIISTEIFKIEEEMTEKMKPKVANPPSKNGQNSLLKICTPFMSLCIFMTCYEGKTCFICC